MRRIVIVAATAIVALTLSGRAIAAAPAQAAPRTVSVINGAGPNDWAASQTQIRNFEPGVLEDTNSYLTSWWGGRTVSFANMGGWTVSRAHRPGWRMFLTRRGLGDGVLGFHSVDAYGPYAVVSVTAARQWATPVSWAVSHELNEMMIDPYVNQVTNDGYNIEVVDPVQDQSFMLKGVVVADFTTPNWYVWNSEGPWDAGSVLARDHSMTPGGYAPTTFLKTHEPAPAHLRAVTPHRRDEAQTHPVFHSAVAWPQRLGNPAA
jgi:hypothetical protein